MLPVYDFCFNRCICQAVSQMGERKSRGRDTELGPTLSLELGRRGEARSFSTWHPGASEPMFPSGGQKAGSERGGELPEHTQRMAGAPGLG